MGRNQRSRAEVRLDFLKGRIAEALVEAMFKGVGFTVSRSGRESQLQRLFKSGRDEFLPDFMIRRAVERPVERPDAGRPLHQLVPIEVKYRYDVARFLNLEAAGFFRQAANWPGLYLILVTENPSTGRSCFQVMDGHSDTLHTSDLHTVASFNIFRSTVLGYEDLCRKLFGSIADNRSVRRNVAKA